MRIKIRENILTIPDKLISEIDKLDIETANAINLLRLQNKPINAYQITKLSGVSYNTARKYLNNQK